MAQFLKVNLYNSYAFEKKVWNELDEEALSALRKIIQYKEKSIIYRELFKGNYNDTYIWNIVKKLQRKHLVIVHREGKNVIKFEFLPVLEELVPLHPKETIIPERAKEKVIQELDTFCFSLKTNLNKSTPNSQIILKPLSLIVTSN